LGTLWLALFSFHLTFGYAQVGATLVAMTANFLLNNAITYRDRRLRRWDLVQGLLVFYLACSIGVLINFKLAELARNSGAPWYLAGAFGLMVGSVWNYGVTRIFTWRTLRRENRRRAARALRRGQISDRVST
jgi:dolichol-phosphate mannosyltransferase